MKTGDGLRYPWVRIPLSPPKCLNPNPKPMFIGEAFGFVIYFAPQWDNLNVVAFISELFEVDNDDIITRECQLMKR